MSPLGRVRAGNFSKGSLTTLPKTFGNKNNLGTDADHDEFANPIPSNKSNVNTVNWTPSPAHFGNSIGGNTMPTFAPSAGTYPFSQVVLIIAKADAIYFTTDGSTPTTRSQLYQGSVRLNVTTTIKAIAVTGGTQSSVATAVYTIT